MNDIFILDTFKISNYGIHLKKYHLQRTIGAFKQLEWKFSDFEIHQFYKTLEENFFSLNLSPNYTQDQLKKVRCQFKSGNKTDWITEVSDIEQLPTPLTLELISENFQISGLGLQNYKISRREYWDYNLKKSHSFDVIGVNQDGFVTETSRFNLFIKNDDLFFTPTLNSGCINGCFRQHRVDQQLVEVNGIQFPLKEKNILARDLSKYEIFVGNSLRGVNRAILI